MEINKYATGIASAFIKRGDKYLVVYSPVFEDNGFWRVPGGRIEFGEKAEDTLVREMKEELNTNVKVKKFLGFGQDHIIIRRELSASRSILFFECEIINGEPEVDNKEAIELKWVTLDEMKKLIPLEPALKDLFSRFEINKVLGGNTK